MKIRNKNTGQIFEVLQGTRYPSFFEEVKENESKAKIPVKEDKAEPMEPEVVELEKPKKAAKSKKSTKKGKKNA